jgi:hypothetical protein
LKISFLIKSIVSANEKDVAELEEIKSEIEFHQIKIRLLEKQLLEKNKHENDNEIELNNLKQKLDTQKTINQELALENKKLCNLNVSINKELEIKQIESNKISVDLKLTKEKIVHLEEVIKLNNEQNELQIETLNNQLHEMGKNVIFRIKVYRSRFSRT